MNKLCVTDKERQRKHKFWDVGELCSTCTIQEAVVIKDAVLGCSDCHLVFCRSCSYKHCCCEEFTEAEAMLEAERQYGK